jgi:hypothetical protein
MTIEDGCYSLKLECALRELGFIEVGYRVIAHAGLYFVSPVSYSKIKSVYDELLGFQLFVSMEFDELRADCLITPTAKRALDVALGINL